MRRKRRKKKLIMFKVLEQTELSIGLNNSKGITEVRVVSIRIMRKSTNLEVKSRLGLLFCFPSAFSATKQRVRKANSIENKSRYTQRVRVTHRFLKFVIKKG